MQKGHMTNSTYKNTDLWRYWQNKQLHQTVMISVWVFPQELQKENYVHAPPTGRLSTALHLSSLSQQVGFQLLGESIPTVKESNK